MQLKDSDCSLTDESSLSDPEIDRLILDGEAPAQRRQAGRSLQDLLAETWRKYFALSPSRAQNTQQVLTTSQLDSTTWSTTDFLSLSGGRSPG